jgi:hypothetical protein
MTPFELITLNECSTYGNIEGERLLAEKNKEKNLVAYLSNDFGIALLLKGRYKFFYLFSLKKDIHLHGHDYHLVRIKEVKKFLSLKNITIVNEAEFEKFKAESFLNYLNK